MTLDADVNRILAVAFTVLFVAAARYFWTHDEKAAAIASAFLGLVSVVEGVLGTS